MPHSFPALEEPPLVLEAFIPKLPSPEYSSGYEPYTILDTSSSSDPPMEIFAMFGSFSNDDEDNKGFGLLSHEEELADIPNPE